MPHEEEGCYASFVDPGPGYGDKGEDWAENERDATSPSPRSLPNPKPEPKPKPDRGRNKQERQWHNSRGTLPLVACGTTREYRDVLTSLLPYHPERDVLVEVGCAHGTTCALVANRGRRRRRRKNKKNDRGGGGVDEDEDEDGLGGAGGNCDGDDGDGDGPPRLVIGLDMDRKMISEARERHLAPHPNDAARTDNDGGNGNGNDRPPNLHFHQVKIEVEKKSDMTKVNHNGVVRSNAKSGFTPETARAMLALFRRPGALGLGEVREREHEQMRRRAGGHVEGGTASAAPSDDDAGANGVLVDGEADGEERRLAEDPSNLTELERDVTILAVDVAGTLDLQYLLPVVEALRDFFRPRVTVVKSIALRQLELSLLGGREEMDRSEGGGNEGA